jgi:hypothetical protein
MVWGSSLQARALTPQFLPRSKATSLCNVRKPHQILLYQEPQNAMVKLSCLLVRESESYVKASGLYHQVDSLGGSPPLPMFLGLLCMLTTAQRNDGLAYVLAATLVYNAGAKILLRYDSQAGSLACMSNQRSGGSHTIYQRRFHEHISQRVLAWRSVLIRVLSYPADMCTCILTSRTRGLKCNRRSGQTSGVIRRSNGTTRLVSCNTFFVYSSGLSLMFCRFNHPP